MEVTETCAPCTSVLEWLKGEQLSPAGTNLTLPPGLAHLTSTGTASGLRTSDGRLCALLKTSIGWKENFEGVFCTDGPLRRSEVIGDDTGRPYISIGDASLFQELYIRRRYSDRCYAVFFDLN